MGSAWRIVESANTAAWSLNDIVFRILLKNLTANLNELCHGSLKPKSVAVGICKPAVFLDMPEPAGSMILQSTPATTRVYSVIAGDSFSYLEDAAQKLDPRERKIPTPMPVDDQTVLDAVLEKIRLSFDVFVRDSLKKLESFSIEVKNVPGTSCLQEFLRKNDMIIGLQCHLSYKERDILVVFAVASHDFIWLIERLGDDVVSEAEQFVKGATAPCILLVEDNANIRNVISLFLVREGFVVRESDSGEAAFEILETQKVDLIVLDVMLPTKDGYTICKELKENPKFRSIPVIFCTAKSQKEDVIKALGVGGVDYITKPFTKSTLVEKILAHFPK